MENFNITTVGIFSQIELYILTNSNLYSSKAF